MDILGEKFGYTTNDKGYKVLNNVRLIQVGNNTALLLLGDARGVVWCADLTSPRLTSPPPTCAPACVPPPQGDGVNEDTIRAILDAFKAKQWSADNIAFGMGGALLQVPRLG